LGIGLPIDATAAVGGTCTIELVEPANSDLSSPTVPVSRAIAAEGLAVGSRH
jgi:hypothetical protein